MGTQFFICKPNHLNHVFGVVVADRTNQIPAGLILLTGLHHILIEPVKNIDQARS